MGQHSIFYLFFKAWCSLSILRLFMRFMCVGVGHMYYILKYKNRAEGNK